MARRYFTLCIYDAQAAAWFDNFGSYSRPEVVAEYAAARDDGYPVRYLAILDTDETAAAMIAARDALPLPRK